MAGVQSCIEATDDNPGNLLSQYKSKKGLSMTTRWRIAN
jgi:hypothetical protein